MKEGIERMGNIWRECVYGEDGIWGYRGLYWNGEWSKSKKEVYDYGRRMGRFDIDGVGEY